MIVRMTVRVELDPDVWAREYGLAADYVRTDVRDYVANTLYGRLVDGLQIAKDVTVTGKGDQQ